MGVQREVNCKNPDRRGSENGPPVVLLVRLMEVINFMQIAVMCVWKTKVFQGQHLYFDLKIGRDRGVTDGEGEAIMFYKGVF